MHQFACGSVVGGCDALWVCASEEQVLALALAHIREEHGDAGPTGDVPVRVRRAIATVPERSVLAGAAA